MHTHTHIYIHMCIVLSCLVLYCIVLYIYILHMYIYIYICVRYIIYMIDARMQGSFCTMITVITHSLALHHDLGHRRQRLHKRMEVKGSGASSPPKWMAQRQPGSVKGGNPELTALLTALSTILVLTKLPIVFDLDHPIAVEGNG